MTVLTRTSGLGKFDRRAKRLELKRIDKEMRASERRELKKLRIEKMAENPGETAAALGFICLAFTLIVVFGGLFFYNSFQEAQETIWRRDCVRAGTGWAYGQCVPGQVMLERAANRVAFQEATNSGEKVMSREGQ